MINFDNSTKINRNLTSAIKILFHSSFSEITSDWDLLFKATPNSYFSSSQWHKVVLALLSQKLLTKTTHKLVYFKASANKARLEQTVIGFFYVKTIFKKRSLSFSHLVGPSDYYDFIYGANVEVSFIKQIFTQIIKDYNISDFSFSHIRKESKLYEALASFNSFDFQSLTCVAIALEDDYESHLKKLSKSVRQNLRTADNRIAKNQLSKEISFLTPKDVAVIGFQQLKVIYKKRSSTKGQKIYWKTKLHKLLDRPFRKELDMFDSEAIKATDFILGIIKLDDQIAAYFFGLKNRTGIEINRVAINDEFKLYSPGMVLLNEFIERGFELGLKSIDLTVGDEKYKYDLGGKEHLIYNIKGTLC